jgi:hypothetical protein
VTSKVYYPEWSKRFGCDKQSCSPAQARGHAAVVESWNVPLFGVEVGAYQLGIRLPHGDANFQPGGMTGSAIAHWLRALGDS